MTFPQGIASDPNLPGHIYVSDSGNFRIDEFDPWGQFVKAWGWGVNAQDPQEALQTCTEATGCRKGTAGEGAGQFRNPEAIGVDAAGMVYVIDAQSHRVQKFDPTAGAGSEEAELVATFGEAGSGPGQFAGGKFAYLQRVAVCAADGSVFVGEGERVQKFTTAGVFQEQIALGKPLAALAIDSACDLYIAYENQSGVTKIAAHGPSAEVLAPKFEPENSAERPRSLAVDGSGVVYVRLAKNLFTAEPERINPEPERVQAYAPNGQCLTCGEEGEPESVLLPLGKEKVVSRGFDRTTDGTQPLVIGAGGACDPAGEGEAVYVAHFTATTPPRSFLRLYGVPDPTECEPPHRPPVIEAQFATNVGPGSAQIRAEINPKFWAGDVGTTRYYAQWGPTSCLEVGGWEAACMNETAAPPGVALNAGAVDASVPTQLLRLEGLAPGTEYSYRFVAVSDGGGPVYGEAPVGGEASPTEGLGASFATFRVGGVSPECPGNEDFRGGPSALLPDCRAYEMVSPLEKEGGDIVTQADYTSSAPAVLSQSAVSGDRMSYGSYRSFGGAEAAPYTSQYLAARRAGVGWESHPLVSPEDGRFYELTTRWDTEMKAFSPDLCTAWVQTFADPPLAPAAPAGFADLYRRSDEECGGRTYVPLNETAPPSTEAVAFKIELQGVSDDGQTAIFLANDALAPGAVSGRYQLYARRGATQHLLCILPGGTGTPLGGPCTGGGKGVELSVGRNRFGQLQGALSRDGNRAFWTATNGGPGKIYLRENPFGEGTECSAPTAPCTIAVSAGAEAEASSSGAQFIAAAGDGSRALFITGGRLYEYDVETDDTNLIAGQMVGVMGASENASRVYLVSREAKGGANGEGKAAVPGEANVYFHEGSSFQFVGVLAAQDVGSGLSPVTPAPFTRTARVSPDGLSVAFTSYASFTGYDNRDAVTGERDTEVFLYRASDGGLLVCASCNPGGGRPTGALVRESDRAIRSGARLQGYPNSLYPSRMLSDDGGRLYFQASDALLPRDSNGHEDVYQWEAPGHGGCTTGSPAYSPRNGGCIDLISSGDSRLDATFLDATPSGSDVFFSTAASLVPQDYGLVDVYDARVDGGLPSPQPPSAACEGESCQGPYVAPEDPVPASSLFRGRGNEREEASRRKPCKKPKVRKASKCARKKHTKRRTHRRHTTRGTRR